MSAKTVKVSNLSLKASQRDVSEFFSFSGDIVYVVVQSNDDCSQNAFVTFTDSQGAETAVLLSGATIVDMTVSVTLAPEYHLPPEAAAALPAKTVKVSNLSLKASQRDVSEFFSFSGDIVYVVVQSNDDCSQNAFVTFTDSQGAETAVLLSPRGGTTYTPAKREPESALSKAEDMMSNMFAKGFVLGKDAVTKAKSFDQKHGLTQKVNTGTSMVTEKVKEVDQKLQISENAKSTFAATEQAVSNAGSAIMRNRYVITSMSWVTSVVNKVVKTASEAGQQREEKAVKDQHENKQKVVDDFAHVYLTESPKGLGPTEPKPALVQGLII